MPCEVNNFVSCEHFTVKHKKQRTHSEHMIRHFYFYESKLFVCMYYGPAFTPSPPTNIEDIPLQKDCPSTVLFVKRRSTFLLAGLFEEENIEELGLPICYHIFMCGRVKE